MVQVYPDRGPAGYLTCQILSQSSIQLVRNTSSKPFQLSESCLLHLSSIPSYPSGKPLLESLSSLQWLTLSMLCDFTPLRLLFNYILLSAFGESPANSCTLPVYPHSTANPPATLFYGVLYGLHYVNTLHIEIRAVWASRRTGTSVLFLLNRHGFMLNQILNIVGDLPGNINQSS